MVPLQRESPLSIPPSVSWSCGFPVWQMGTSTNRSCVGVDVTTSNPSLLHLGWFPQMLVVTGTQGGLHACVVSAQLFHLVMRHPASFDLPDSQQCCLYLWRSLGSTDWCVPFLCPSPETPLRQSTKAYVRSDLLSTPGPKALHFLMSNILTT